jgi:hypothetical protein
MTKEDWVFTLIELALLAAILLLGAMMYSDKGRKK